jgi:hypothetical protein
MNDKNSWFRLLMAWASCFIFLFAVLGFYFTLVMILFGG